MRRRALYSQDGTRLLGPCDYRSSLHGPGTGTGYAGRPLPVPRELTPVGLFAVRVAGWLALALALALLLFGPALVGA